MILLTCLLLCGAILALYLRSRNTPPKNAPNTIPGSATAPLPELHPPNGDIPPSKYVSRNINTGSQSPDSLVHHGRVSVQSRIHLDEAELPVSNHNNSEKLPVEVTCTDLNTATMKQLEQVSGIGPARAQSVINDRTQNGPFKSMDDLHRITGISEKSIEYIRKSGFCITDVSPTNSPTPDSKITENTCENAHPSKGCPPEDPTYAELCAEILETSTEERYTPPLHDSIFDRSLYQIWGDADGNCRNTRHEVLIAHSQVQVNFDETECKVIRGEWADPYTNTLITNPRELDIDHLVPLAEAHRSGSSKWSPIRRYCFANDLSENGVLIPVSASANRSKGDRDPAHWLPENEAFHCQYVERWVAIKKTWGLSMDPDEQKSIEKIQAQCSAKEP